MAYFLLNVSLKNGEDYRNRCEPLHISGLLIKRYVGHNYKLLGPNENLK
jgi:hypothetical protein